MNTPVWRWLAPELESLLHLPLADRDLFVAKLLSAFIPAVTISWLGFLGYAITSNVVGWSVLHRIFVPTSLWLVVIFWVGPAVAAFGLGVMVRVSMEIPGTDDGSGPARPARIACAMASTVQSGRSFMLTSPQARPRPRRGRGTAASVCR